MVSKSENRQADWYHTRQHRASGLINKAWPQEQDSAVWRCYFNIRSHQKKKKKKISKQRPSRNYFLLPSLSRREIPEERFFKNQTPPHPLQTHRILTGTSWGLGPDVYVNRRAVLGHSTRNTEEEILLLNSYFLSPPPRT